MLEVENYHHLFHCVCPEYLEVVSLSWDPELDKSRYVCSKVLPIDGFLIHMIQGIDKKLIKNRIKVLL